MIHITNQRIFRALASFQESFILRLFREKKMKRSKSDGGEDNGFVKAFTDDPARIAGAGLGQLQRLVDRLYVRRVALMPRFDEGGEHRKNNNMWKLKVSSSLSTQMRHTSLVFHWNCLRHKSAFALALPTSSTLVFVSWNNVLRWVTFTKACT